MIALHRCHFFNTRRIQYGVLTIFSMLLVAGCAASTRSTPESTHIPAALPEDLKTYAEFVVQNIQYLNARYSDEYLPIEFIVDTELGSTRIQNLLDLTVTAGIAKRLVPATPDEQHRIAALLHYVTKNYTFILQPFDWHAVKDTISMRQGDCKNLSLLLMSLLLSADFDAHACISNGHMWVTVYAGGEWRVLEIDQDPRRKKIYRLPGFYEHPLYRIYSDRSLKRKRIE